MSIVPLPDNKWRSIRWGVVDPTQVNRSEFTSARQAIQLPGAAYWRAEAEHAPMSGEASIRAWRSFFTKLRGRANTFLLPACQGRQAVRDFYHLKPFVPIDAGSGVTISGDARDVTRTAVGAGYGQAWAYYGGTVSGGCRLSFRAAATSVSFMAGLNASISGATGSSDIDYAFECRGDNVLLIHRSGVLEASYRGYSTADIFSIVYDDVTDTVTFYRNGESLNTFAAASGLALRADIQFYDLGAAIKDVSFGALAGVAAGTAALNMAGPAGSQDQAVSDGMFATALFEGGGAQLVVITESAGADGAGELTVRFEPALRGKPFAFLWGAPWGLMAMDASELGYSVNPGALYGFGFSCTEGF